MKLGLGTAQFGLKYGVSNKQGQVPEAEVKKILELADERGVTTLDTAALYGDSERALGQALPARHRFRIVTKTPQFKKPNLSAADAATLLQTFRISLDKLRQDGVYGLLIHHAEDLFVPGAERLIEAMQSLRDEGLVQKIGASVYTPAQARRLPPVFDLVQLPLNLLDQRALSTATLAWLKERGFEVHARSVFLQGLLLLPPAEIPASLQRHAPVLHELRAAIMNLRLQPMQAALAFVDQQAEVDQIVVGVCSCRELREILDALHAMPSFRYDFSIHACPDESLINPSAWS